MARTSTYLNFSRNTEAAFHFYKSVFGGEFSSQPTRFKDIPEQYESPDFDETERNLIVHIELPIMGGHVLMGTDAPESLGFKVNFGNNVYINLEPDSMSETERLFQALSDGGVVEAPLEEREWGSCFGTCTDKFGVQWMFNYFLNAR